MKKHLTDTPIRGIIFDYGATIDSNGTHWAEVIWQGYQSVGYPIAKDDFRKAYVYAERALAMHPYIKPEHNFLDLLRIKMQLQQDYIVSEGLTAASDIPFEAVNQIAAYCYGFARGAIERARPVLEQLAERYRFVLVSNFYGNIEAVLTDFGLIGFFPDIIESAVVGVRKPDPRIFALGVERMGYAPQEIVVVGDSYKKDILPAQSLGCPTVWIQGPAWDEADNAAPHPAIIRDFGELLDYL
jgi:putative hydrolase of the HAD superfamily